MVRGFLFWANVVFVLAGRLAFAGTNFSPPLESEIPKRFYFDPDLRSVSRELKHFSEREGVAFWIYDFRKHRLVSACGLDEFQKPQPMGSILKPFTALAAWASSVDLEGQSVVCPPSEKKVPVSEACWNRSGHGTVAFPQALALSCNFFFASLSDGMNETAWKGTFALFHIEVPALAGPEKNRALAIGSDPDFLVAPSRIFFAYLALFGEDLQEFDFANASASVLLKQEALTNKIPGARIRKLRDGFALTQKIGTVKNQKHFPTAAWVKTGTSYAMEMEDGEIDPVRTCGWVFAALPVGKPRLGILLRKNRSTGAAGAYPELVKLLVAFEPKL